MMLIRNLIVKDVPKFDFRVRIFNFKKTSFFAEIFLGRLKLEKILCFDILVIFLILRYRLYRKIQLQYFDFHKTTVK